jgi:hypothetical protein
MGKIKGYDSTRRRDRRPEPVLCCIVQYAAARAHRNRMGRRAVRCRPACVGRARVHACVRVETATAEAGSQTSRPRPQIIRRTVMRQSSCGIRHFSSLPPDHSGRASCMPTRPRRTARERERDRGWSSSNFKATWELFFLTTARDYFFKGCVWNI